MSSITFERMKIDNLWRDRVTKIMMNENKDCYEAIFNLLQCNYVSKGVKLQQKSS